MFLYGEPRLIKDIDNTLRASPERFTESLALVAEWGWRVLLESPAKFVGQTMLLPCLDEGMGM